MNTRTSWFVMAATAGIVGCKTIGPDTILPALGPHTPEATRVNPEASRLAWLAPKITPVNRLPVVSKELRPVAALKTVPVHADREAPSATRPKFIVHKIEQPKVSAVRLAPSVTTLPALPKPAQSVRIPRTDPGHPHVSAAVSAQLPELPLPTLGNAIWTYATPVLTGLCVYILAPLLVDMIKQRLLFARRDAGKPGQAV